MVAGRDERGRFVKGAPPANPGGRPPGTKGLAALARAACRDGEEIVDYMASVLRNPKADTKDRMQAAAWLADRGWGKPVQAISGEDGGALRIRLTWGADGSDEPA